MSKKSMETMFIYPFCIPIGLPGYSGYALTGVRRVAGVFKSVKSGNTISPSNTAWLANTPVATPEHNCLITFYGIGISFVWYNTACIEPYAFLCQRTIQP